MAIKKGEEKLYRQYPLNNNMTNVKKSTILTLLQKYRKISEIIQTDIIHSFQKTGYINKYMSYKNLPSYDSIYKILPKTAYIQMAMTQVIEMLCSRESNIQNAMTLCIEKLESKQYTPEFKHMLHALNNQSRIKLASCKMVFGYQKGIEEHVALLNNNNLQIYRNKTDSDYRLGLQKLKQSLKKEKITKEQFDNKEKILLENRQEREKEEANKVRVISYNSKNMTITVIKKDEDSKDDDLSGNENNVSKDMNSANDHDVNSNNKKDSENNKKVDKEEKKVQVMIPDTIYTLYKQIYRHVTKKWKYPSCKKIAMRIDSRCMAIETPEKAFQSGKLLYWLKLNLIESIKQKKGKSKFDIHIPLLRNEYFLSKKGILANSVFIGIDEKGKLFIRIMKNMTDSIKKTKADYQHMVQTKYKLNQNVTPVFINDNKRIIALDFGLRVMFTDDEGNQYGRDWFSRVRDYDSMVQKRVKELEAIEQNPKLSQDETYVSLIRQCRSYIKNEVNRVLQHIIQTRNPEKIILENIRFINPDLSKSMNRLIQNCGRSVINAKLESLKEEYDVDVDYVNPAYTSQICSNCGVIHKESRKGDRYECIKCGNKLNADVNAARNILFRYLMNNVNVSKKEMDDMEPCSISLTMSKKSVRNTVEDTGFQKIFYLMKGLYWRSITAQEPMA